MESIYDRIAKRTGGDIYIGVVGPVRTGKSTFIKQFMEQMVLPNIADADARARARDELPQSASGKTVMTAEPKFVPENGVTLRTESGMRMQVRMVDCVGYLVDGALGGEEDGAPRMVMTPWSAEKMEFSAAARLGTKKVMHEHATVGIVVTTDGSIGELDRAAYAAAEEEILREMEMSGKPYVLVVNCASPHSEEARRLGTALEERYGVPVALVNCTSLSAADIEGILTLLLGEFPIRCVHIDLPAWVCALPADSPLRADVLGGVRAVGESISKVGEVRRAFSMGLGEGVGAFFEDAVTDLATGEAVVTLSVPREHYFKALSDRSGMPIADDAELFDAFLRLSDAAHSYARVAGALADVEQRGYGIVMPGMEATVLGEPQLVKTAGGYGMRLPARVQSVHMIKADIEAEVSPIVGSEAQAEELVRSVRETLAADPSAVWEMSLFGRSLYTLVEEALRQKLAHIPAEAQTRLSETLERVINEGSGGLICIIL